MKVQVASEIEESVRARTLIELSSEVLSLKETIRKVLAPVIDDGSWALLDEITAESRGMQRLSARTTVRKERSEDIMLFSNGKNTIYLLDFTEQERVVKHDPIIRIVGKDALTIAAVLLENIATTLTKKIFMVNGKVLKDLASIFGGKTDVERLVAEVEEEAEQVVKRRLAENV